MLPKDAQEWPAAASHKTPSSKSAQEKVTGTEEGEREGGTERRRRMDNEIAGGGGGQTQTMKILSGAEGRKERLARSVEGEKWSVGSAKVTPTLGSGRIR